MTSSIDQIPRAFAVLVTGGEVAPGTESFAQEAGVAIVPISPAPNEVGERVAMAVELMYQRSAV